MIYIKFIISRYRKIKFVINAYVNFRILFYKIISFV